MGRFRSITFATALLGGGIAVAGSASAAPIPAGVAATAMSGPVETVQWGWGYAYGPRYGYYGPRRYWGPRHGFYGPRRFYGPPVVCRFRPTPWGPRRVCFRRY
jgi:hypothetical protein